MLKRFLAAGLVLTAGLTAAAIGFNGGWAGKAAAASNTAGPIVQSYNTSASVLTGMLVEGQPNNPSTVVPLPAQDARNGIGVVVPADQATVVLAPSAPTAGQVLVASSGQYDVLVSTQNGPIKAGDYLTVSGLAGIAMKADGSQPTAIGRAVAGFDGSNYIDTTQVKNGNKTISVEIGRVAVNIKLENNPLYKQGVDIPAFLTGTASTVAGKSVSAIQVVCAVVIAVTTLIITVTIFYSGIKGGVIAIGRNPLSSHFITRSLMQTFIIGLVIAAVGLALAYLVLKV